MQSKARTVKEYLASLPIDRRNAIEAVRKVLLANLGKGYEEGMMYGMIAYYVPHALYPPGYHCDQKLPLGFFGLASQKNYLSLYVGIPYYGYVKGEETSDGRWFRESWAKTGKKLDMGKCCVRFRKVEDLALDVIGEAVRRVPVKRCISTYVAALDAAGIEHPGDRKPVKKETVKKVSGKTQRRSSDRTARA